MRKVYSDILAQIKQGQPSAILTSIPKDGGKAEKSMFTNKDEVPERYKEVLKEGKPTVIQEDNKTVFIEPVQPKDRLIVLGGGHIAMPLVKFAAEIGFSVTICDDRPSFANEARFPQADRVICETFEDCFDLLGITEYDYVVIITRGHRHDTLCLRKLLALPEPFYLGMIGSKRRVQGVKEMLIEEGFDADRINRIFTPIGLNIGAVTPEEISISILAEIIKEKRLGRPDRRPVQCSDLDPEVIRALAGQASASCSVVTVMSSKGSVPRGPGAKMIVFPDRSIVGSIGGGCSESDVIWDAMTIIGTGRHLVKQIDLTGDIAESEGMVCGGIMDVLVEDFTTDRKEEVNGN